MRHTWMNMADWRDLCVLVIQTMARESETGCCMFGEEYGEESHWHDESVSERLFSSFSDNGSARMRTKLTSIKTPLTPLADY